MITKDTKKVLVVMERYNPQSGCYCTIHKCDVKKFLKNTVIVEIPIYGEKKFDVLGYEKDPWRSIYGTTSFHAYTVTQAKELFDGEKFNHCRILQGIEILQAI